MEKIERYSWVVLAASFFSLFFNSSLNYSVGVIHIALLERYSDVDVQTISWIGSLFSSMFAISGFVGSIVINVFNVRVCVMISGVVTLIGFTLSSLVTDVWYLFITYSLIAGTGQAMCNAGSMVTLGFYFKHKTSMASGIAVSASGLCTFVFPPLSQFLVDTYGLNGAFLLLGSLGLQSTVCGALMRPTEFEKRKRRKPFCSQEKESKDLEWCKEKEILCTETEMTSVSRTSICRRMERLMQSVQFWLFLVSCVAFNMGQSIVYLFLPNYYRHLGSTSQDAAFILSIAGLTGIFSRFILGFLTQIVNSAVVFGGMFGIMGIVTFFVNYMLTLVSKITFTAMLGFYTGACWGLFYTILVETVGLDNVTDAFGVAMIMCGVGYLTGPPLAEMVALKFDNLYLVFVFAGVSFLVASMSGFLVKTVPNTLNTDLLFNKENKEIVIGEETQSFIKDREVAAENNQNHC